MKYFNAYIKHALEKFYEIDMYLIREKVSERTMAARIAHYLIDLVEGRPGFIGINVDCEYNKNLATPKYMLEGSELRIPDIVAHKRNSDKRNLFVIEMKKDADDRDRTKIKNYVDLPKFRYKEGYALQNIKENSFHIYFYKRGVSRGIELDYKVIDKKVIRPQIHRDLGT